MYIILAENKNVITKANDFKGLAKARLFLRLKEEGYTLDNKGIKDYLNSWFEWSEECLDERFTDVSECIDMAVSNLIYSNTFFINFYTKVQLSNEERKNVDFELTKLLKSVN